MNDNTKGSLKHMMNVIKKFAPEKEQLINALLNDIDLETENKINRAFNASGYNEKTEYTRFYKDSNFLATLMSLNELDLKIYLYFALTSSEWGRIKISSQVLADIVDATKYHVINSLKKLKSKNLITVYLKGKSHNPSIYEVNPAFTSSGLISMQDEKKLMFNELCESMEQNEGIKISFDSISEKMKLLKYKTRIIHEGLSEGGVYIEVYEPIGTNELSKYKSRRNEKRLEPDKNSSPQGFKTHSQNSNLDYNNHNQKNQDDFFKDDDLPF